MVRFLVMCSDIAVFARSKRFSQNGSFCENSLLLVLYTVCPSGRAAIRAGGKKYMNIGLHGGTKNRRGNVVAFWVQRHFFAGRKEEPEREYPLAGGKRILPG